MRAIVLVVRAIVLVVCAIVPRSGRCSSPQATSVPSNPARGTQLAASESKPTWEASIVVIMGM